MIPWSPSSSRLIAVTITEIRNYLSCTESGEITLPLLDEIIPILVSLFLISSPMVRIACRLTSRFVEERSVTIFVVIPMSAHWSRNVGSAAKMRADRQADIFGSSLTWFSILNRISAIPFSVKIFFWALYQKCKAFVWLVESMTNQKRFQIELNSLWDLFISKMKSEK